SGSSATLLKLLVPSLGTDSKVAQLSITTSSGTATHQIVVNPPPIVPVGKPLVSNVSGTLPTITAGGQYTLSFKIDATGVSTQETYAIGASWSNPVPASIATSAWSGTTTLIGVQGG